MTTGSIGFSRATFKAIRKEVGLFDTWKEDCVREWSKVRREARESKQSIHILRIVCICVEKNAEAADPKKRKYKGRCVCLGNDVRNEYGAAAMFAEWERTDARRIFPHL